LKSHGLTVVPVSILLILSEVEVSGIPGVAVKCVDIRRNTKGEGSLLDLY
jgi:hypothetical protein